MLFEICCFDCEFDQNFIDILYMDHISYGGEEVLIYSRNLAELRSSVSEKVVVIPLSISFKGVCLGFLMENREI